MEGLLYLSLYSFLSALAFTAILCSLPGAWRSFPRWEGVEICVYNCCFLQSFLPISERTRWWTADNVHTAKSSKRTWWWESTWIHLRAVEFLKWNESICVREETYSSVPSFMKKYAQIIHNLKMSVIATCWSFCRPCNAAWHTTWEKTWSAFELVQP